MTAAGYTLLEQELKHCQQVERPRIIQQITDARSHGDLSENAEYHAAKEAQSHNEGRIAELEDKLARAEVIDVSKLSGDTIKFGATVTLIDEEPTRRKSGSSSASRKPTPRRARSRSPRRWRARCSARRKAPTSRWSRPAAPRPMRSSRSSGGDAVVGLASPSLRVLPEMRGLVPRISFLAARPNVWHSGPENKT